MNQNTRACRIEYGVISFLDFNKLHDLAHKNTYAKFIVS